MRTGGSGNRTIDGTSLVGTGVYTGFAQLLTGGGNIAITGRSTAGSSAFGLSLGGQVRADGNGTITLIGTGIGTEEGSSTDVGVAISGQVTTVNGNLSITGLSQGG